MLFMLLMTIMIPGIVMLIPLYLLSVRVGLFDNPSFLIMIYAAWQTPMAVWLLRAFFESIPQDLEDTAVIDGCTRLGAFYRIVMPLARPGMVAAAIVVFVWVWNEFIIALNLTAGDDTRPVTVGLYSFIAETSIIWGSITSGVNIALLPILVLFALVQRSFIMGLTSGARRG